MHINVVITTGDNFKVMDMFRIRREKQERLITLIILSSVTRPTCDGYTDLISYPGYNNLMKQAREEGFPLIQTQTVGESNRSENLGNLLKSPGKSIGIH